MLIAVYSLCETHQLSDCVKIESSVTSQSQKREHFRLRLPPTIPDYNPVTKHMRFVVQIMVSESVYYRNMKKMC